VVDRATVLVVDDEPHIRLACSEALRKAGHEVVVAEDGRSAEQAISSRVFDGAVLDIVLPDSSGLKLLESVRAHNPNAVVVLITGFASLDTAMEAVRLGAYEYLRKPFAAGDLVRILDRGLESTRLRDRNARLLGELRQANLELLQQQARLRERVRLAGDELTAFVELGRRLNEGQDLAGALRCVMEAGMHLTRARAVAAYKAQSWPRRLRGLATVGLASGDVLRAELRPGEGLIGGVLADGVARIENDVLAGLAADDHHLAYLGVQSVLACPLSWEGELQGVMAFFDHQGGGFSTHALNLVGVLAVQAARIVAAMDLPDLSPTPGPDGDDFVDLADLLQAARRSPAHDRDQS